MEEWKDIEGYEGLYQVSNLGRVLSLPKEWITKGHLLKRNSKILKLLVRNGYYYVVLCKNKIIKKYSVHRLVGLHFIPNPKDKPQVNHIDGNKLNNNVSNLEWNTSSENAQHAYDIGLRIAVNGEKHYNSKLTEKEVKEIRSSNLTVIELCKLYNISQAHISDIIKRESWKHI